MISLKQFKRKSENEKSKDEKTVSPESKEKIAEQGSAAVSNLRVLENIEVKLNC